MPRHLTFLLFLLAAPSLPLTAQETAEIHSLVLLEPWLGRIPEVRFLEAHRFVAGPDERIGGPLLHVASLPPTAEEPRLSLLVAEAGLRLHDPDRRDRNLVRVGPGGGRTLEDFDAPVPPAGRVHRDERLGLDRTRYGRGIVFHLVLPGAETEEPLRRLTPAEAAGFAATMAREIPAGDRIPEDLVRFLSRLPLSELLAPRELVLLREHLRTLRPPGSGTSSTWSRGGGRTFVDDPDAALEAARALTGDMEVLAAWEERAHPLALDGGSGGSTFEPLHVGAAAMLFHGSRVPEIRGRAGLLALRGGQRRRIWSVLDPLRQALESGEAVLPGPPAERERVRARLDAWAAERNGGLAALIAAGGGGLLLLTAYGARGLARRALFA